MHEKVSPDTNVCIPINLLTLIVIMRNFKMLVSREVVLERDTSSWCGRHLCHAIPKSLNVWQSYSPDTNEVGMHRRTDRPCEFLGHKNGKQHIILSFIGTKLNNYNNIKCEIWPLTFYNNSIVKKIYNVYQNFYPVSKLLQINFLLKTRKLMFIIIWLAANHVLTYR
jgi:hypothetical protein